MKAMTSRRHVWDDVSKSFDAREATALLKSAYREGWGRDAGV